MLKPIYRSLVLMMLFAMIAVQPLFAQSQTPAQPSAATVKANELFQSQKWPEAVAAFEALTKTEPQNGMAWFRLGVSLISLNKNQEAVAPFQKAVEIMQGPMAMYLLGATYAQLRESEKAFASLLQAADAGFSQLNRLQNDPMLASLRTDPRYQKLVEEVRRAATPCESSERARELDFWVGEWEVQLNGQTVGINVIERSDDGCIIQENWKGQAGFSGRSINFFNPRLGVWRQTFVGSTQAVWEMTGEFKDGAMRYNGQIFTRRGITLTRVVLYKLDNGQVRHTQEDSTDEGKTWTNVWDSIYVRKTKAK